MWNYENAYVVKCFLNLLSFPGGGKEGKGGVVGCEGEETCLLGSHASSVFFPCLY